MPENDVERRGDLRFEVRLDNLQVTVGFRGFESTTGAVLDISRGGIKVALEHEIPRPLLGNDCHVRFVADPHDRVIEKSKSGKLLRMEVLGQYAIEFARPMDDLNVSGDPESFESGS